MTLNSIINVLFLISLISLVETIAQICFKKVTKKSDMSSATFRQMLIFSWRLLLDIKTWVGLWLSLATLWLWGVVLSRAELNFAFCLSSMQYIFIAIASKFILKEQVNKWRWLGTLLITIGIAVVSFSQNSP